MPDVNDLTSRTRQRSDDKTRKSIETRKRIMNTAAALMVERGNSAFKMSEISALCGMSKGALYYYFADHEDLIAAIYDQEMDDLIAAVKAAAELATSTWEALENMCNEFARRVGAGGPLPVALIRDLMLFRENDDGEDSKVHTMIEMMADMLERGKTEGIVREDVDAKLYAAAACGAYTFAAVGAADPDTSGGTIRTDFVMKLFRDIEHGVVTARSDE